MTPRAARLASLVIRSVVAAGLGLLLYLGVRADSSSRGEVLVSGATTVDALAADLATIRQGRMVYVDSVPPSRAQATLLAAATHLGREVTLSLPDEPPALLVRPPHAPIAQRRTALSITVRGDPNTEVRLTVADDAGQSDTVTVAVGRTGVETLTVGVEPARAGLARWTVTSRDLAGVAQAAAWVRPPSALAVLVLTAAPDWEVRYLVRALEEGGASVTVRQAVGDDLVVTSSGASSPATLATLEPFDVVVTTSLDAEGAPLERWMNERGGGVVLLELGGETVIRAEATEVEWTAPAEWLPLPGLPIEVAARPVASLGDWADNVSGSEVRALPVASFPDVDGAVVAASSIGRGRLVVSGLESWPWVLEGGARQAHSDYWHSVAEWAAGGLRSDVLLHAMPALRSGLWAGHVEGALPRSVGVEVGSPREFGTDRQPSEAALVSRSMPGRGTVRFVSSTEGAYPITGEDGDTLGAAIVLSDDDRLGWPEAAATVGRGGGALRPHAEVSAPATAPLGGERRRDWPVFLLLGGLMAGGWAARRISGLA